MRTMGHSARRISERTILAVVVLFSVTLTVITVWSVVGQSQSLQERKLYEVRTIAQQAADRMRDALEEDVEERFYGAGLAWLSAKANGLDIWAGRERPGTVVAARRVGGSWTLYPTSPSIIPSLGGEPAVPSAEETSAQATLKRLRSEILETLAVLSTSDAPPSAIPVFDVEEVGDAPIHFARREIARDVELAIVRPQPFVVQSFLPPEDGGRPWEPSLDPHYPDDARFRLAPLGEPFGSEAALVATESTIERLRSEERRSNRFVLATAAGAASAWGLVIWLVLRLLTGRRELIRLQRRIVADVSHELKTPLALIRLMAETLREQRIRDPDRQMEYLDTITRESERLSLLLESILDFSKLDRADHRYELSSCDPLEIAHQAWTLFEPQFQTAGFDAKLEIDEPIPTVHADPQAIKQILVNLLQNAYRYAGDNKFVRLRMRGEGHVLLIEVVDRGIGMSNDQLNRLGASFIRGEDPRVRQTRGAGLGLAIINHIVTAHRGKMEVQSRENAGTTFTIWIPISASATADVVG